MVQLIVIELELKGKNKEGVSFSLVNALNSLFRSQNMGIVAKIKENDYKNILIEGDKQGINIQNLVEQVKKIIKKNSNINFEIKELVS